MHRLKLFLMITSFVLSLVSVKVAGVNRKIIEKQSDAKTTETFGSEPDYNKLINWAASPFKEDTGDSIPYFLKEEVRDTRADVFFIHSTSYFSVEETEDWNADLSESVVNYETDSRSILFQASLFNGSCRVFAPRYRQANMIAFKFFGTPLANEHPAKCKTTN